MNTQDSQQIQDIILIDKPAGLSSFGVVARVRRRLSMEAGKKVKVGHTGTLDPFATGLLILLANKATKLSNQFLKLDKWYEATICLGKTSTTGDPEGEITEQNTEKVPTLEEVKAVVNQFVGQITQTVPAYSAVKINGQRAYQLARRGEAVSMPTRQIEIYAIEILSYNYPELVIRTHVSSGTYIRTLGEDIGKALGVGAYLTALRRTQVGDYQIKNAVKLPDFIGENNN
jgi:tRNA pseudouridine synthase B